MNVGNNKKIAKVNLERAVKRKQNVYVWSMQKKKQFIIYSLKKHTFLL